MESLLGNRIIVVLGFHDVTDKIWICAEFGGPLQGEEKQCLLFGISTILFSFLIEYPSIIVAILL